jgi:hypothetical protein
MTRSPFVLPAPLQSIDDVTSPRGVEVVPGHLGLVGEVALVDRSGTTVVGFRVPPEAWDAAAEEDVSLVLVQKDTSLTVEESREVGPLGSTLTVAALRRFAFRYVGLEAE